MKKGIDVSGSSNGTERRKFLKQMAIASASLVSSPMLSGRVASAQAQVGGTLVHLVHPEPPNLATFSSTAIATSLAGGRAYAGLLEYDFELRPKPSLAESWIVSEDAKLITFKLRPDVKFHDGRPFTSADVKYSVLEVLKKVHPRGINTLVDVQDVETPDPYTAVFRLEHPAPHLLKILSGYESPMVPKHLFETTDLLNSPYANAPVGCGPFKFGGWERGKYILFERFDSYFKPGKPYLERVVELSIADASTRTAVLERGEAHLCGLGGVPLSDAAELAKLPHLAVETRGSEYFSPIIQIEINTRVKPFDDKRVRQALAYAIDRNFVLKNLWFGYGKVASGPIPSVVNQLYTTEGVKNYNVPNALDIANNLLDEAGYKRDSSGIRFEVTHDVTPYGDEWNRFGDHVRQRLDLLGIKTILRIEDPATWLRRVYTNYDFQFTSDWPFALTDPVLGIHRQLHSRSIRPGVPFVNCSGWSSERTDELMDKAQREPDSRKRAALYREFQQIVVEECPIVYALEAQLPTVYNKKFTDVITGGMGLLGARDQTRLA
ncbi:ABC transporter substrate-binding protein [Aquamicrobium defluvii]|uniref:ABC transporter substrate-binding protein n=1 Tax=Aquamicrobium defluvii TaxID=69279 RepID=A0A011UGF2_9HYPH|nr:ABC transporter substrate-binding protein [Aquamicrobium defluvii]EXL04938.1 ABC transporter substrate-binding protein [Aquamicrobium defluvii]EZQ14567.1 ABC transporter substrate-binding protein [Halopseudomonas bauzanensis]